MVDRKIYKTTIGGREVEVETGAYCGMTNGTCLVKCEETVVMVNVTMSKEPRDGVDFFPLNVDYEEKMYSVGKIPGGFKKREGRPSDKGILVCRLIDRPLRPLFPKGFYNDVSVVATCLSVNPDVPPEIYAMIGSSVALSISDIPFAGPTGSVVVGYIDGQYIINPSTEQREKSRLHLSLSGTKDAILMVEAGANELTEEEMIGAILFGHEEIKRIVAFIESIQAEIGKEKIVPNIYHASSDIEEQVKAYANDKMDKALEEFNRQAREKLEEALEQDVFEHFAEIFPEGKKDIAEVLYNMKKEKVRAKILEKGIRPDGRTLKEIRPIWCEHGILPRVHGSGVFTRGQTQVLTTATLGSISEVQKLEGLDDEVFKRYIHHYNFPGYSVGEAKPAKSPGRREIG
ncbi:MAG: polyribonucleotide nucleotidyltransferase, partial [Clostridia bacterium]|nr:polyribonucleotide nucleotidyltransferase [Clostridia bacterium]